MRSVRSRVSGFCLKLSQRASWSLCLSGGLVRQLTTYLGPLRIVADFIPSMKIQELMIQFGFLGPNERDRMKQTLRQAVKDNYTLQSVKYQFGGRNPSDASEDDETFQFYLQRNIRLAQWVENPATVPKHLWKEATTLATKAGPYRCSFGCCGKLDLKSYLGVVARESERDLKEGVLALAPRNCPTPTANFFTANTYSLCPRQ